MCVKTYCKISFLLPLHKMSELHLTCGRLSQSGNRNDDATCGVEFTVITLVQDAPFAQKFFQSASKNEGGSYYYYFYFIYLFIFLIFNQCVPILLFVSQKEGCISCAGASCIRVITALVNVEQKHL